MTQGGGLADAGFTGEQADAGGLQQPAKALPQVGQTAVIPEVGAFLVERAWCRPKCCRYMVQSSVLALVVP